ncbi:MAG: alkane 1-monooxygenase [Calditrichaeota bacterium]|nr:alkane 1-monooxygenase [Calditrichota bacterium]
MKPWIFLQYLFIPAFIIVSSLIGGWWTFTVPVICFVIHPLVRILVQNSSSEDSHDLKEQQPHYSHIIYRCVGLLFVPILVAVTGWAVYIISYNRLSLEEFVGLVLSVGIMNGVIGFTLAHEFIHRKETAEKISGEILLLLNNYLHYKIEHINGHHVYACTYKDPHTALVNESFYHFLPRTVKSTFFNAWEIESKKLIRERHLPWSIHNRIVCSLFIQFLVLTVIFILFGWLAILFLLLQSAVAIFLLHITNYLQHYGLLREKKMRDRYEKFDAHHAWASYEGKDNLNLFQLGNHADHHMHPGRSYEKLLPHTDSPQMPTGYSGMIILALIPPIWFRIMNKRISTFITQNTTS